MGWSGAGLSRKARDWVFERAAVERAVVFEFHDVVVLVLEIPNPLQIFNLLWSHLRSDLLLLLVLQHRRPTVLPAPCSFQVLNKVLLNG